jgi:glycyl-tRNA synthetase
MGRWNAIFVRPGDEIKHYEFWEDAIEIALSLGLGRKITVFTIHEKLAHAYA